MKVSENQIDISQLTPKWLITTFNDITSDSNSEIIEDIKFLETTEDEILNIEFNVDCGRYGLHRHNNITINNRGYISVGLCEILEGGGIEEELIDQIKQLINE